MNKTEQHYSGKLACGNVLYCGINRNKLYYADIRRPNGDLVGCCTKRNPFDLLVWIRTVRKVSYRYQLATSDGEDYANARLIASAPEMLEALKASVKIITNSLPSIDPDDEEAHFAGEWLGEIKEIIERIEA